jgi:transposase
VKDRPKPVQVDVTELERILDQPILSDEDRAKLRAGVHLLQSLQRELEQKDTTLRRLRKVAFGASTEKTRQVCGESTAPAPHDDSQHAAAAAPPKRKGHGRNGASRYPGANRIAVPHPSLHPGDACPSCERGKLHPLPVPAVLLRIRGQAPITGTVHELDRLRCNTCGKVFTAPAPAGIGEEKYDVTVVVLIAVLKYGFGMPFYRLARLQAAAGIPLPAPTQWALLLRTIAGPEAAYAELIRQAAQGRLLHNDDTYATLLGPVRRRDAVPVSTTEATTSPDRTGTFTSGIVALHDDMRIALFFTGHQHAGENLHDVLRHRAAGLDPPLHMCDALSRNLPKEFATILCNCLAHARRSFVDVEPRFPDECRHVLETLRDVYHQDELARQQHLSPEQRLAWHQEHSAPLMTELEKWFETQFKQKQVEPNSTLGDAIRYMQKHWDALTQFLRVPGAPLDNNVVERALKRAILHRKNAMFFRTLRGAHVADVYMSLIHTAELSGANPIDYLRALMENAQSVIACPSQWLPWNYQHALPAAA